jgi:hypothetical protein
MPGSIPRSETNASWARRYAASASACLPARYSEHELCPEALAERVPVDDRLELRDELGVATEFEVGFDSLLEGGEPLFLEPGDLVLCERLCGELHERGPSPAGEGVAELGRPFPQVRMPGLRNQQLEPLEVELSGVDVEDVSTG